MAPEDRESVESLEDLVAIGDVIAEKYRVEGVIGTGGMGVVVQAFHLHFEEKVAIKFLHHKMGANEEALARFEREARAAFKIKSEHVARVIDVGKMPTGAPYMVMEYLEGIDIADVLARQRRLPLEDALQYIMMTAEAVAEAHTLGIIHRDLKPENMFLTHRSDGTPCIKVLDFGLSKIHAHSGDPRARERTLTASTQPMGTPQYMSPEQWMSAKDTGPATDIWALGVLLYELITGVQPFNKEQLAQLCTMVLQSDPEPMSKYRDDIPPTVAKVVSRCLEKKPEDRYANVARMALELYHVDPRNLKASARRIAGVFRRAGIDVGTELSKASAPPGLDVGMLTEPGYAPAPQVSQEPRPSRGKAYESTTAVMPERDQVSDLAKTINLQEGVDDARTLPVPPGMPVAPLPDEVQPPAPLSASSSGKHLAVPAGDASSSGRFLAHPGDDAAASGNYAAQHYDPTASAPEGVLSSPRKRRADTAQSWQHMLVDPSLRPAGGGRRMAIIVGTVAALLTVVVVAAIVGSLGGSDTSAVQETPEETAPAAASEGDESAPETSGTETSGSASADEAEASAPPDPPAAAVSASASASASATAARKPPVRRTFRRRAQPRRRVVESKPPPKKPPTIFDGRR